MEIDNDAVTALNATIQTKFGTQLAALQAIDHTNASLHDVAHDAVLSQHVRSTNKSAIDAATAWTRMLATVFRRYARQLIARGKLLNQEELLVSHFARLDSSDSSVCIPSALGLRFVVRCIDGPVDRVGSDDVVARIETDCSSSSSSFLDTIAVVVAANSDDVDTKRVVSPSQWEHPRALTALETLYGFDVRSINAPSVTTSACVARLADAHDDCANAVLLRASVFRDLRATQLLQQRTTAHAASPAPPLLQSFIMGSTCAVAASHPQSYVSLGQAQKRAWATERFRLGQHLVAQARVKDAIAEFTSCLQLDDTYADALYARSDAYVALQQFRDAVSDLEALRTLDAAFPGLDAALARAQSKLRHAQRVDVGSSAASAHRGPASAIADVEQALPQDSRSQKPLDKTTWSRSRSCSRPTQTLERERLRTLLEAEVAAARRKRASDGSSSDDDERRRRHRKSSKHKKQHKRHKKKHKKRRRHETRSESSESESERSRRKRGRSSSRHRSRRSRSDSNADAASSRRRRRARSRSRSPSSRQHSHEPALADAPHPILARERHRIWN